MYLLGAAKSYVILLPPKISVGCGPAFTPLRPLVTGLMLLASTYTKLIKRKEYIGTVKVS